MSELTKDKKKRVLIAIILVILLLAVLFVFYFLFNKGIIGKSNIDGNRLLDGVYIGEELDNDSIQFASEKCNASGEICITELEVVTDGNKGVITYKVKNKSDSPEAKSGTLRVTIGDQVFVFPYNNVAPYNDNEQNIKTEVFGYDGYDIDFGDYSVDDALIADNSTMYENMSDEDKTQIQVN